MTALIPSLVACLGALSVATPVRADDTFPTDFQEPVLEVDPYSYAWFDPRMRSVIGVGVMFGGGIIGFTDDAIREQISNPVAFAWNARVSIGTHIPLGIELNYFGSAGKLVTLSDVDNGMLIGTAFEAALRYTILPHADGTPYVFAGAGWQRYDVEDPKFTLADTGLSRADDVAVFPVGAGMAYRDPSGWVGELRGVFRPTTESSLVTLTNGDNARLDSWEVTAELGYEF